VVAPADLPAGYRFEAEIEGVRFIATVPPGGVQQGETFTCVMQELDSVAIDIPVGHWKDGSCDLCVLGCCHPSAWHAIFCPLILLSQVQTRLDLDFLGRPRFGAAPITNRSLMFIVVTFWIVADAVLFTACNLKWSQGLELTAADWCAVAVVNVFLVGFVIFITQATRGSLREKYMIREERCFDLEDLCCAVTCLPCSVAQMARHTANYHNYEAVCCSKTGLPDGVKVDRDLTAETTTITTTTGSENGGGDGGTHHHHNDPVHDGGSNGGYAV
jgi:Cys-rich protein (TIGR01571 family)